MSDTPKPKAVLVCCMDYRHGLGRDIDEAIREATGVDYGIYRLTGPGGAGMLTDLYPEDRDSLVKRIKLALSIGAEKIFLAVHGTNTEDDHGCGGFIVNGFGEAYETPARSRTFSFDQLKRAARFLRSYGIAAPIAAFYVTFAHNPGNVLEEVLLDDARDVPSGFAVASSAQADLV